MDGRCANCRYWDGHESERGNCRHASPRTHCVTIGTELEVIAVWPGTRADDWCGQFRPRNEPRGA